MWNNCALTIFTVLSYILYISNSLNYFLLGSFFNPLNPIVQVTRIEYSGKELRVGMSFYALVSPLLSCVIVFLSSKYFHLDR